MGDAQRRRPFWYLRRRTVASDVDEELRLHVDLRAEELNARGMPADAARREALRQFGDIERTREYCRQQDEAKERRMQWGLWLEDLAQDLRISLRGLLRAPIMTLTIVATVGLGIGATTVIFSAVDAALLRPLPYANPDRLFRIYTDAPPNRFPFSVADYLALQAQHTRFEQIGGYTDRSMTFSDGAVAERLRGRQVSWTFFSLLGVQPAIGRTFTEAEGKPGAPAVVILGHRFWQQRLGGRADVIGRAVRLDGADYTVVGVLPEIVGPLEQGRDFFLAAQWDTPPRKGPFFITALGRLAPGTDASAAIDELRAVNRRIFPLWRASYQDSNASWSMIGLKAHIVGDVSTVAGLALVAVALVWLIACANASNLLVARVTGRRRELAVRAALGASRGRVVRYLLAESTLLALGAAAIGGALAWSGIQLIRNLGAAYFPRTHEIALDGAVLWVLVGLTAASALMFGLLPALHGTGGPVDDSLRATGRSSTGSVAVRRLRRALVASQFAIATPLLVVAGLLLTSLNQLSRVDLGFDTRHLYTATVQLPMARYHDPVTAAAFWHELERRVEAIPGVSGMAFADGVPPNQVNNFNNFNLEQYPTPPGQSEPVTPWVAVSAEYFRFLGLRLLEGRAFDERDGGGGSVTTIVVDRAWANRFFPGQDAIGKRLREGGCSTCPLTTVVGVVSDVRYAGLDKPNPGTVYWPMAGRAVSPAQSAGLNFRFLILRSSADPAAVLPTVRQILRELDPDLALSNTATMEELVAQELQRPRSLSMLVGTFAAVALTLAIIGIYGVMAYYVQHHAKEIGIRLALGGSPAGVLRLIVAQGMTVVAGGVGVGLMAALALARLMSSLLYGVGAADALTFSIVSLLMLSVALAACVVPARRAVGVQPAIVLRDE